MWPYSELFWSVFLAFELNTERYSEFFPTSGQMRENTDQNNSKYEHFLRSGSSQPCNMVMNK